jgi:hypothetical protein
MVILRELAKDIAYAGFVFSYNEMTLNEWDTILDRINKKMESDRVFKMSGPRRSFLCFCTQDFFNRTSAMLESLAEDSKHSTGYFDSNDGSAASLVTDMSFHRGNYDIYMVIKPVNNSIVVPVRDSIDVRHCALLRDIN